jgi:hypothetical protein
MFFNRRYCAVLMGGSLRRCCHLPSLQSCSSMPSNAIKTPAFELAFLFYIFTFSRMFQPYLIGPPSLLPSAFWG